MINTKLIFVDGMSGSGKSTTAHYIARQIEKNGHKVRWFYEDEDDHPLAEMEQNKDESDADFAQRILKDYPQKWIDFVNKVKDDDCIYILESFLFQNIISNPVANNIDKQTIKEHVHKLCSIAAVACLNPVVIHFYQEDIEAAVCANWLRRGDRWKNKSIDADEKTLFCTSRNLIEEAGVLHLWKEKAEISSELFEELTFRKIQLENSKHDWQSYRKQIMNFLELQMFEEFLFDNSFERFCGNYCGIIIYVKDNRLCVDAHWPNLKLLPVGENEFQMEGFPIVFQFIADENNQINSFKFSKALCYFKEGKILPKIMPVELNETQLKQICGEYWCEAKKLARKIYLKDRNLYYWQGENSEIKLIPVSPNKLFMYAFGFIFNFEFIADTSKLFINISGQDDLHFVKVETKPLTKS